MAYPMSNSSDPNLVPRIPPLLSMTRDSYGFPYNSEAVGFLVVKQSDETQARRPDRRLPLYGGRVDRHRYEYHAVDPDSGVKLRIKNKENRFDSINEGDVVTLHGESDDIESVSHVYDVAPWR